MRLRIELDSKADGGVEASDDVFAGLSLVEEIIEEGNDEEVNIAD